VAVAESRTLSGTEEFQLQAHVADCQACKAVASHSLNGAARIISGPDPATDLSIAWTLLPATARSIFRTSVTELSGWVDGDTWIRARGWALALGLVFLASSRDNELLSLMGRTAIDAVLSETEIPGVAPPK